MGISVASEVSPAAQIRFRGVGKSYDRAAGPVLENVDLDVLTGELLAVVGPSGCGKSTLLNVVAGLTQVSEGAVELADPDLRCAYVFQSPRLLPWRSVTGNVEFALEQTGLDRTERRRRAREALDLVNLTEHGGRYPHQLSGGMQQRAALARGLTLEPKLLLLDEPFAALDALTRGYLQEELLAIVRRAGTTTILVTHDIDEALLLADRVVVMSSRPARIRQLFKVPFARHEGDLDEALSHPEFVPLRHAVRALLRPDVMGPGSEPVGHRS
ncbi:MAG: ABC transporter ATP-binding protein [Pseudonocardia sp.]|nr:ABC transporter ATP-binding protein [Pseudonocardia sp.]